MAGRGAAPKPAGQRRRRNEPMRGEWVDLEPLKKPVLPRYEKSWQVKDWMWEGWRKDPVTSQYTDADLVAIRELAERFYDLKDNEQRLRMDELGLTPKGKRDLRWRPPAGQPKDAGKPALAVVTPLKQSG